MSETQPPIAQLPLELRLSPAATFETFVADANAEAVTQLRDVALGARRETVWLSGERGSGKSHLLQAACAAAAAAGRRAIYVPCAQSPELSPSVLTDLHTLDLVGLDDVDRVAGDPAWEQALFLLLDAPSRAAHADVLLSARQSPESAGFAMRDLASRAAGATRYRLVPLGDDGVIAALTRHAASRGLELDPAAARFLLHRVARDMSTLCAWLERLDGAALAARRPVTIPLIRGLLGNDES